MDEVTGDLCKYKNCGRCQRSECQRMAERWRIDEERYDTIRLGLLVAAAVTVRGVRLAVEGLAKIRGRVAGAVRRVKDIRTEG